MLYNRGGLFFVIVFTSVVALGQNFLQYVDPFIGIDDMGHTYPGKMVWSSVRMESW